MPLSFTPTPENRGMMKICGLKRCARAADFHVQVVNLRTHGCRVSTVGASQWSHFAGLLLQMAAFANMARVAKGAGVVA